MTDLNSTPLDKRPLVRDTPTGAALSALTTLIGDKTLYYIAATLRPETMYGQTNCFVGVDIDYGVFIANESEVYICTERAAKNMSWQGLFSSPRGTITKLADLKGWDLIGVPLKAPLSFYDKVYTLPMEGVLPNKVFLFNKGNRRRYFSPF